MTEFLKHPFWQRSEQFFTRRKTILWLCVLLAVFIAVKQYRNHLVPGHAESTSGTHYNNFLIYKYSFWHLLENKNLYLAYPSEYVDHYLYGPAFSALFAPLAILPNFLGILLWCLLNTVVFWIAIRQLPVDNKKQCLIFWIALNSLYTTLVNLQINSLLSAFIIMSYAQVHRKNDWLAALFILLGAFIKIYGIVGFVFFFFSKQKKQFVLYSILWTVVLFFLPWIFSNFAFVAESYKNWYDALTIKGASNIGSSSLDRCVMGMFRRLFNDYTLSDLYFIIPSLLLFGFTLIKINRENIESQMMMLASVLIYIILASTGAESPTYIFAIAGTGVWYAVCERTPLRQILFWLALVISSFTPADFFPSYVRTHIIYHYGLSPLPLLIVWLVLHCDLLRKPKLEIDRPR